MQMIQDGFRWAGESTGVDWNMWGGVVTTIATVTGAVVTYWVAALLKGTLGFVYRWGVVPPVKAGIWTASLPFRLMRGKPAPTPAPLSPLAESLLEAIASPQAFAGEHSLTIGKAEIWPQGKPDPARLQNLLGYIFVDKECADRELGDDAPKITRAAKERMDEMKATELRTRNEIMAELVRSPLPCSHPKACADKPLLGRVNSVPVYQGK